MRGLRDKVMVVAGGGTGTAGPGNGAATAIRLADEGARVVVGDLSPEAAAATVALIAERGGTASAFGFDIADEGSVQDLVDFTVTTYGGLDGVHASAADMSPATLGRDSEIRRGDDPARRVAADARREPHRVPARGQGRGAPRSSPAAAARW